jgi:hypothetical protein
MHALRAANAELRGLYAALSVRCAALEARAEQAAVAPPQLQPPLAPPPPPAQQRRAPGGRPRHSRAAACRAWTA